MFHNKTLMVAVLLGLAQPMLVAAQEQPAQDIWGLIGAYPVAPAPDKIPEEGESAAVATPVPAAVPASAVVTEPVAEKPQIVTAAPSVPVTTPGTVEEELTQAVQASEVPAPAEAVPDSSPEAVAEAPREAAPVEAVAVAVTAPESAPEPAKSSSAEAATVPPRGADGEVVSLHLILEDAMAAMPEVAIARERLEEARAGVDEARAAYRPTADIRGVLSREYNSPFRTRSSSGTDTFSGSGYNNSGQATFNARQNIYDGGSKSAAFAERKKAEEVTQFSRDKINQEVVVRTTAAYINSWRLQGQIGFLEENRSRLEHLHAILQSRVKKGDASKAEATYMEGRILGLSQQIKTAQASLEEAWIALGRYTGVQRRIKSILPDDMYSITIPDTLMMQDNLIRAAEQNNFDLKIAKGEIEVLERRKRAEYGKSLPSLDALLDGDQSRDVGGDTGIVKSAAARLQLSYRLYDGGLNSAGQRKLLSQIRSARFDLDIKRQDMLQSVRKGLSDLESLTEQIRLADKEYETHIKLYAAYERQFKLGELDLIVIADNVEKIQQASLRRVGLRSDYAFAIVDLLSQAGQAEPYLRGDDSSARRNILQSLGFSLTEQSGQL
ncbi:MAG: TolC family protein [Holosporales bacterium]